MNIMHTRRSFLRGLGLGAGATLLSPVADKLLSRAYGSGNEPCKRFIIMSVYMLEPFNYTPAEIEDTRSAIAPFTVQQWPEMFAPLGARMQQAVFIDGARMRVNGAIQHRSGACALNCMNTANGRSPESMAPAGGPTIDQYIAQTISRDAPRSSLLWGITGNGIDGDGDFSGNIFASGREQNLQHFAKANAMLRDVFNGIESGGGGSGMSAFRPIRDVLVADLQRLKSKLASEERLGLERFEGVIEDFDRRQAALAQVSCDSPPAEVGERDAQAHFESMMLQSTLALQCGLTNVIGATIGTSGSHNRHIAGYREIVDRSTDPDNPGSFYGHGGWNANRFPYAMEHRRIWHQIHLRNLNQMIDRLETTPEVDGSSAWDHTTIVYTTGNAHSNGGHHADRDGRWPALIVAGARTPFQTGGRYLKFTTNPREGRRGLVDIYRTVAEGIGANGPAFSPGAQDARGLVEEILT